MLAHRPRGDRDGSDPPSAPPLGSHLKINLPSLLLSTAPPWGRGSTWRAPFTDLQPGRSTEHPAVVRLRFRDEAAEELAAPHRLLLGCRPKLDVTKHLLRELRCPRQRARRGTSVFAPSGRSRFPPSSGRGAASRRRASSRRQLHPSVRMVRLPPVHTGYTPTIHRRARGTRLWPLVNLALWADTRQRAGLRCRPPERERGPVAPTAPAAVVSTAHGCPGFSRLGSASYSSRRGWLSRFSASPGPLAVDRDGLDAVASLSSGRAGCRR